MPPKKKEEPVEEVVKVTRYTERIKENVLRGEDGEELCSEIMQDVVMKAEEQVMLNYFDRTAIPYTVQGVCKEMLDLVQFVFVARDTGDVGKEAEDSWVPDAEPLPCPTDTWARGAIPVRNRANHAEYDARSVMTPTRRKEDAKPKYQSSLKDSNVMSQTITTSEGGTSRARNTITPSRMRKETQQSQAAKPTAEPREPKEEDTVSGQKQELKRRAELREAAERQNQTLRELKAGKEYIIDSINGKVIPVKVVDPKRLPSKRLDMKYEIEEPKQEVDRRVSVAPPVKSAKKKGKREERTKWGEHVQPEDTHGPMVVGAMPVGGVTIREGDTSQRTELKNPKGKVSKVEYKKMLDAMGVSRDTVDMVDREMKEREPMPKKPPTPQKDEKPAAGTAFAAVIQQQPQVRSPKTVPVASTPVREQKPKKQTQPATFHPQAVAPLPANRHAVNKGDLHQPKGRDRKLVFSPRQNGPAPLPAPLYPATQGHGKSHSDDATSTPSRTGSPPAGIKLASEIAGTEIADDLLHHFYDSNQDFTA